MKSQSNFSHYPNEVIAYNLDTKDTLFTLTKLGCPTKTRKKTKESNFNQSEPSTFRGHEVREHLGAVPVLHQLRKYKSISYQELR